jgi:endonuclease/exonuclease/phosphatase family metal-dependent hydrolase
MLNRFAAFRTLLLAKVLPLLAACLLLGAGFTDAQQSAPEVFRYAELGALYDQETLSSDLTAKLNSLLTTPIVDNSIRGNLPVPLARSSHLGEFLRVAEWNIERGIEYAAIEAALAGDEAKLAELLDPKRFPAGGKERQAVFDEARALHGADVIVLNEVDYGLRRTDYRNVAGDLARRLGMNYAFGVQFIELSAVYFSRQQSDDPEINEILKQMKVDRSRYKGLHGIAIVSRFPLENVRLVPFKEQPYDWYRDEKSGIGPLEKGKRLISEKVFLEESTREVRRGGRTTLYADISDSRFPNGRVTIAATHLENRAKPSGRVKQLEELLDQIKEIPHPVVVAGDMNTSSTDLKPTSLRRLLVQRYGNREFWIKKIIPYSLSFGFLFDLLKVGTVYWRRSNDPTVRHIPLIAANPARRFFTTLREFRFADGGAFDLRGEPLRSTDERGRTLSDSNERAWKGFVTTYQVNRPIAFLGKNKLDWIFVKPARLTDPRDRRQSYQFAPHSGRTLADLNEILKDRISDHRPLIVDLPLGEPNRSDEEKERSRESRRSNSVHPPKSN